jgi:type IV secretion system protein VirB8
MLVLSTVAVGAIIYVVNAKQFEPFVIQIDDVTGMAKIVNPASSNVISGNEALARYFIKRYVTSRETYNPVDFTTDAKKVVRLLSENGIYWNYLGYLKDDAVNPVIKYGQKNTTYLTVKSWSKLTNNKYLLRFAITETSGSKAIFNKIAIVEFDYRAMQLTEEERDVNPIGFQVIGYRVDDDNS